MSEIRKFDVVVMGGGSGLTAAYYAEKDGKSVAVIEERPDAFGGTCVNRGCIPTKGLIQSAEVIKTIREAERFGIHLDQSSVQVDFAAIMDTVRGRRDDSAASVKSWVSGAFTPFYGSAQFVDEKVIELDDGSRMTGDKIFIATGARPATPPIPGLNQVSYWTNETVLEQRAQPSSLIVLGGGYIGCEFGHFFASLGTKVTVIDAFECLLREDDDVRALFTSEFGKKVELVLGATATEVMQRDGQLGMTVKQNDGSVKTIFAEALLVATGRKPNTDGLHLERTQVDVDPKGWVRVDAQLRTSHPDIYAYGDVTGQEMFKHTSSYEGELAYKNSQGANEPVSYRVNPHAVFSDPQIGSVGLTERACQEQGLAYTVAQKDYSRFAKGKIIGSPAGFAKLLVEKDTDRILGFHMIGPNAADLVHEVAVAMNSGQGSAELIRETIHIHPTLAELIKQVFMQTA